MDMQPAIGIAVKRIAVGLQTFPRWLMHYLPVAVTIHACLMLMRPAPVEMVVAVRTCAGGWRPLQSAIN